MKFIVILINFLIIFNVSISEKLEEVSDDDILQSIKMNEYAVVFFTKSNCDECEKYETQLLNIAADLKESLNAPVIKAFNSQLVRLYNPTKEPAVVFFRHGVGLLYDGPIEGDAIYQKFEENKMPIVKELSDENFEHLTQAATGATTGDWFVIFYSQECIDCQRLSAVWEAVGAQLKNRLNVARINKDTVGKQTAKRFSVRKVPEFIFIRQGKFYRYEIRKYDVKSFVSFAQEFYKNARAEKVQVPSSPFDDLVDRAVMFLRQTIDYGTIVFNENPKYIIFSAGGFLFVIIIGLLLKICCKKPAQQQKKEKKSK